MLKTKEAIEKRGSVRKFLNKQVSRKDVHSLIGAARLAPSGSNSQPWRFRVVKDKKIKQQISEIAYNQAFIAQAPTLIVCCADVAGYVNDSIKGIKNLEKSGAASHETVEAVIKKRKEIYAGDLEKCGLRVAFNVALAIENMQLRALDLGLGSCIVGLMDKQEVKEVFGWGDNIYAVAVLAIGYPDEAPRIKKLKKLKDIMI